MNGFVMIFVQHLKQYELKNFKFKYSRWAVTYARKRKTSGLCHTQTSLAVGKTPS
jgi:hypothetical protein